jgi:hypothetical protein
MAGKRTSAYLTNRTFEVLGNPENFSGELNKIIDRYGEILRRSRIEKRFNEKEWALILDVLKDQYARSPATALENAVFLAVEEVEEDLSLHKMSETEHKKLLEKIKALSYAEQVCLIEAIEREYRELFKKFQSRKR